MTEMKQLEKRVKELEIENRLLGERCNQLLKDKGELTDQIADIKANCDLAIEGRDVKIADLEKQLEQVKVLLNAEREVNEKKEYLQYTEYLMAQLEVAKDLIHQFLIQNPISDWLPKKAEQFLKDVPET